MSSSPFLLRLLTKPIDGRTRASDNWLCSEKLPHLIQSTTATRAGYYQAYNDFALSTRTPDEVNQTKLGNFEIAQSDLEPPTEKTCLGMCQIENPATIEIQNEDNLDAELDSRVYRLIQDFDPRGIGHTPAPFILNVQVEPADDEDYNEFYREEHLHMLSKVPGYRRSQRYELVSSTNVHRSKIPRFMAVHEFEHLNSLDGPELREADASPNTHRVFGNAKMVNIRGFKLVQTFGDIEE